VGKIREIAGWSRAQGDGIGRRLDLILAADSAAVSGLTGPPGVTGKLAPASAMATLLSDVSNPAHEQEDLKAITAYVRSLKDHPAPIDPALAEMINNRSRDAGFCAKLLSALGPDGLVQAVRGAQRLGTEPFLQPKQWQDDPDKAAVAKKVIEFQNTTATSLARLLASASHASGSLPTGYAEKLVTIDPGAAGILFTYGDKAKVQFGGRFAHQAATAMKTMEVKDPNCWETRSLTTAFGDVPDSTALHDPMTCLLRVAKNSPESAQATGEDLPELVPISAPEAQRLLAAATATEPGEPTTTRSHDLTM
jgi:hypothetical protein